MMRTRHAFIFMAATVLCAGAAARDVAYEIVVCNHAKQTMLEANADMVAFGLEQWGVVASSTVPELEKATTHCVGYMRIAGGKPVGKGMCKWFTPSGDTAVGEWEIPPEGDPAWVWMAGTGALKGIRSTGSTFRTIISGKPAQPGTSQSCRKDWGTYTVP